MKVAFVGCGFVADLYMETLAGFDEIEVAGFHDRDADRLAAFTAFHGVRGYRSLPDLLADPGVAVVVNLTNPDEHHAVSLAALRAGKHVYSEKPLGMTMAQARELVDLAADLDRWIVSAPCNHLSDVVQEMRRLVTAPDSPIGRPLLVHAELDDGLVPAMRPDTWRSPSGAPWPVKDEFEVGCTIEHAGYQLTPLIEIFGPVRRVTAVATVRMPEKLAPYGDEGARRQGADLSLGILEFDHGVVARLSTSILAGEDRSLTVIGTEGTLIHPDVWEYHAPLRLVRTGHSLTTRAATYLERRLHGFAPGLQLGRRVPVLTTRRVPRTNGGHRMDFARGIAQLVRQIEGTAAIRMDAALALHVTEVTLALQDLERSGTVQEMTTTVSPR